MIKKNISLKNYCSYRTGGKAEYFACPEYNDQLVDVLRYAKENSLPLTILGTGYNVLISDYGVKGLVLSTRCLNRQTDIDGDFVYTGAGEVLDTVIMKCIKAGLGGIENMSGIPGSVGGAVSMNAGAFGTEVKDVAFSIDMCSLDGDLSLIMAEDAGFGYRSADNLEGIVTGLRMRLKPENSDELLASRKEILAKRNEKQPLDFPSCGSVFKRPEGNYAGTLIEKCGLKGYQIGGAQVAEKHANFIINKGGATSSDIYNLIKHVQETVFKETGVQLDKEVRFIGF
ncbi:MAG: UDP-N-acetylenolpyruvoylglucosamine reductase [Denitrovibrio sp.]|nr:MAG: UDP-N-acetylenolpyruvoylglucosamine reductase [Denitrovibrio sp.]